MLGKRSHFLRLDSRQIRLLPQILSSSLQAGVVQLAVSVIAGCEWRHCHEMGSNCEEAGQEQLCEASASQGAYEVPG